MQHAGERGLAYLVECLCVRCAGGGRDQVGGYAVDFPAAAVCSLDMSGGTVNVDRDIDCRAGGAVGWGVLNRHRVEPGECRRGDERGGVVAVGQYGCQTLFGCHGSGCRRCGGRFERERGGPRLTDDSDMDRVERGGGRVGEREAAVGARRGGGGLNDVLAGGQAAAETRMPGIVDAVDVVLRGEQGCGRVAYLEQVKERVDCGSEVDGDRGLGGEREPVTFRVIGGLTVATLLRVTRRQPGPTPGQDRRLAATTG